MSMATEASSRGRNVLLDTGQSSRGLLCHPIRFSMCPSREKSVCQGTNQKKLPVYKDTALQRPTWGVRTAQTPAPHLPQRPWPHLASVCRSGRHLVPLLNKLRPNLLCGGHCAEQWHTVPRTEGPCLWSSRSREEMDKSESRCRGRSKQYAHCDGSLYVATWLGLGAPTLGCSGCCYKALLGAANM